MPIDWQTFSSDLADTRFALPLRHFTYTVDFVRVFPEANIVRQVANFVNSCVVKSIIDQPDCHLGSLAIRDPDDDPIVSASRGRPFLTLSYGNPVYDFVVQIGPQQFILQKQNTTLENLIASIPMFQQITERVFGPLTGAATSADPPVRPLLDFLEVRNLVSLVAYQFSQELSFGSFISQRGRFANNVELTKKLIKSVMLPAGIDPTPERNAPLAALGPEEIRRCDMKISFNKTIAGRTRSLWIDYKGPHNITQRDIDMQFTLQTGEGEAKYEESDLGDWETVLFGFYRDIILNRFFPNFFFDMEVLPRLT